MIMFLSVFCSLVQKSGRSYEVSADGNVQYAAYGFSAMFGMRVTADREMTVGVGTGWGWRNGVEISHNIAYHIPLYA